MVGFSERAARVRQTLRLPLRVVFYKEDGDWIAHCLEFDLLGDGSTREEAMEQLAQAVSLQIEASAQHNNLANLFSPAEGKYFEMFAAGKDVATAALELKRLCPPRHVDNIKIENCEYREFVGGEPCAV